MKNDTEKISRNIRKTLRFSNDEFSQIEEKLSEYKLTFSEFARGAILNKKIYTKLTLDMIYEKQKIEQQVKRIGKNLNSIAKSLNQKSDIPNSEILKTLISIQNEIQELKNDT